MEMKQGTLHMRKSTVFLLVTSLNMVLFALLLLHGRIRQGETARLLQPCCEIARELQLTDLCLFTEARYTRHPAMADLHAAFQDHPLALEHFPSGALVPPPHFRKGGL
jgi:hypothetical protein